jgi:putative glutamine amidotransferase
MRPMPIVAVSACIRNIKDIEFHAVADRYLSALVQAAGVSPIILPAQGYGHHTENFLELCDGLFLSGSPSNVEPHHYDGTPSIGGTLHDASRDATTLPLIRQAIDTGVPILAICRGFQEMNVALGGTLHQRVQEVEGYSDHRAPDISKGYDVYYGLSHDVNFTPGGLLEAIAGQPGLTVNSLHSQGVDSLAPGLEIEACDPDGLIEAFHVKDAKAFSVGVQWHPEWQVMETTFSRALFNKFGQACLDRAKNRAAR